MIKKMLLLITAFLTLTITGCQNVQTQKDVPPITATTSAPIATPVADPSKQLKVHFIDVGQGEAILVVQGDHAMLIDGGEASSGSDVVGYLRKLNISKLEKVIATHPHSDHVGGLAVVLKYISTDNVMLPDVVNDTPANNDFIKAVDDKKIPKTTPEPGYAFNLGDAKVMVVSPKRKEYDNKKNYSIVLRIVYGKTSFLLTGDCQREAENEMLDSGLALSADVLSVPNHGSNSSSTNGFLDAVNASIGVISCGKDNPYGCPDSEVLKRLKTRNVKTFQTDIAGNIVITSDGSTLRVSVQKGLDK